jgi:hypothetical protein
VTRNAGKVLQEEAKTAAGAEFDVFLSHSYDDAMNAGADSLLRLKVLLESHGLTVYVDWIVDGGLSRDRVSTATAAVIRQRMDQSRCLLFVTSSTSSRSKWMPWELGYKDGTNKRVAILPVVDQRTDRFYGQEYLGLYPYVTRGVDTQGINRLWLERADGTFVLFAEWLRTGQQPYRRAS